MPKYEVEYLVTKVYATVIEADSEEEARELFWEKDILDNDHRRTLMQEINTITELEGV